MTKQKTETVNQETFIQELKRLVENDMLMVAGDNIIAFRTDEKGNQTTPVTILRFVRKVNDEKIYIASPEGNELFEAGDFYEFARNKGKEKAFERITPVLNQLLQALDNRPQEPTPAKRRKSN